MAEIIKGLPLLGKGGYHDPANGFVSHSRLHDFLERGAAYYHGRYVTGEITREETPALLFGQATEDLFQLGGDGFSSLWAPMPAHFKDGRSTAAKEWKAAQLKAGRRVISDEDYQAMLAMCRSLRTCDKGMALVDGAETQVTLRGTAYGLPMQARPDWVHLADFGAYSVDLKTCRNLSEVLDGPTVWKLGYHTQAAVVRALMAANGYENASTYLFVVEKQVPYRRACILISDDYLSWGDQVLTREAAKLKECIDSDVWPLGPDEIVQLAKPRWVKDEPPMEAQP